MVTIEAENAKGVERDGVYWFVNLTDSRASPPVRVPGTEPVGVVMFDLLCDTVLTAHLSSEQVAGLKKETLRIG